MPLSPGQIHAAKRLYRFFEAIPKEKWCKGRYNNYQNTRFCALGHLDHDFPDDCNQRANELYSILGVQIATVNDRGRADARTNILTALKEKIEGR